MLKCATQQAYNSSNPAGHIIMTTSIKELILK